jgi:aminomethyltransferase
VSARKSPLDALHRQSGARFTEFAGWEMPVQYRGIVVEHETVRRAVGLFDVSHMGELEVRGREALALCQHVTTNDAQKLATGDAQYTLWCDERGGTIDDTILYRLGPERYLFCVNASNAAICRDWLREQARSFPGAEVIDRSDELGLVAVQGPRAVEIVEQLGGTRATALKRFGCSEATVAGVDLVAARTGYTGEDGFELFVAVERLPSVWQALLEGARRVGGEPIGLGARDTLRLEAGLPLYGHELSRDISPLEAGLAWAVRLQKGQFVGRAELARSSAAGIRRRLIGLKMVEPGIARGDYPVVADGKQVGTVTSGTKSPTLGVAIALALVARESLDARLAVQIRGRAVRAERVALPFFRRGESSGGDG